VGDRIVAVRRAGARGRAPIIEDLEIARTSPAYEWGGPADFTRWRARRLSGIAHDPDRRQPARRSLVRVAQLPGWLAREEDVGEHVVRPGVALAA
jgi:hypothetical protein